MSCICVIVERFYCTTAFIPPVTPNSFSLRPSERAENGMLPENFEEVQISGRPSLFSKFILRSVSLHTVWAQSEERSKNEFGVTGVLLPESN